MFAYPAQLSKAFFGVGATLWRHAIVTVPGSSPGAPCGRRRGQQETLVSHLIRDGITLAAGWSHSRRQHVAETKSTSPETIRAGKNAVESGFEQRLNAHTIGGNTRSFRRR